MRYVPVIPETPVQPQPTQPQSVPPPTRPPAPPAEPDFNAILEALLPILPSAVDQDVQNILELILPYIDPNHKPAAEPNLNPQGSAALDDFVSFFKPTPSCRSSFAKVYRTCGSTHWQEIETKLRVRLQPFNANLKIEWFCNRESIQVSRQ